MRLNKALIARTEAKCYQLMDLFLEGEIDHTSFVSNIQHFILEEKKLVVSDHTIAESIASCFRGLTNVKNDMLLKVTKYHYKEEDETGIDTYEPLPYVEAVITVFWAEVQQWSNEFVLLRALDKVAA